MTQKSFKEKDSENIVKLLNFISDKARFNLDVKETITLYGLMAWAQQDLKPKIDAHVMEVKRVVENPEPKPEPKKRSSKKK